MENTVTTVMVFFWGVNTIFLTLCNPYNLKIRCICKIMYAKLSIKIAIVSGNSNLFWSEFIFSKALYLRHIRFYKKKEMESYVISFLVNLCR